MMSRFLKLGFGFGLWGSVVTLSGCASDVDVNVRLTNPCNQAAVASVDFVRFEPHGTGVDTSGLTTTQRVSDRATRSIPIPIVADFSLVATGHRATDDRSRPIELASALGVSQVADLTRAAGDVTLAVPFALVDAFYRTTEQSGGTCSELETGRRGATATYIPETSSVLVVGGVASDDASAETVFPRVIERFSEATGVFDAVGELPVGAQRIHHTATRLSDGRILVAGGELEVDFVRRALNSTVILDGRAGRLTVRGSPLMKDERTGHTATLLRDGRVLFVGGRKIVAGAGPEGQTYLGSLEIYDPDEDVFTYPSNALGDRAALNVARTEHSMVLLESGQDVLVAGGYNAAGAVMGFELIHVEGDRATVTNLADARLRAGPIGHAVTMTSLGILFAGGYQTLEDAHPSAGVALAPSLDVEIWRVDGTDTATITRVCAAALERARGGATAAMIDDRILVVGGRGEDGRALGDAELASLADSEALAREGGCFSRRTTHLMSDARAEHAIARMEDSGALLVVGGAQGAGPAMGTAEVFLPRRLGMSQNNLRSN